MTQDYIESIYFIIYEYSYGYQYTNIDKEIAGYALQSAIYSKIFDFIDKDGSGIISYSELKSAISNAMRSKFDDKHIEYMTGLVIEHAVSKDSEAAELDKEEFVDLAIQGEEITLDILYDRYKRINQKTLDDQLSKAHKSNMVDPDHYRTTPGMCEGVEIVKDPRTQVPYIKNHNIGKTTCLPSTIADVYILILI